MNDLQVLNKVNLSISAIPFALKGICYLTERFLLNSFQRNTHYLIPRLNETLSDLLMSYIFFLEVMLVISILTAGIKSSYKSKTMHPSSKNPKPRPTKQSRRIKEGAEYLCKLIILYSVIFCSFQIGFTLTKNLIQNQDIKSLHFSQTQVVLRNLDQDVLPKIIEEEDEGNLAEQLYPSSSMNYGEILGSFIFKEGQWQMPSLTLSKDGKTLFAVMTLFQDDQAPTLCIFDISNPEKHREIKRIWLRQYFDSGYIALDILLSPDEKFLFILGCNGLILLDLSNFQAENKVWDQGNVPEDCEASLAISSNGKILYAATQEHLRIFDLSDPKKSVEIYNQSSAVNNLIDISKDNQKIVRGLDSKFEILNVTDPRNLFPICSVNVSGEIISIAFSDEENQILLGIRNPELYLNIFDITSLDSPVLVSSLQLRDDKNYPSLWFHESKNFALFNTRNEIKMINLADLQQTSIFQAPGTMTTGTSIHSWRSNRTVISFSDSMESEKIFIMRFHIDIAPKSPVYFKPNPLKILDEKDYDRKLAIALSMDERNLFLVKSAETKGQLISYEIEKNSLLAKLNSVSFDDANSQGHSYVIGDAKWKLVAGKNLAFASYKSQDSLQSDIHIVNSTNQKLIFSWSGHQGLLTRIGDSTLAQDEEKFIYLGNPYSSSKSWSLNFWTFKDQSQDSPPRGFTISSCYLSDLEPQIKVSKDDSLVFYVDCNLIIYNIKDTLRPPVLESSLILNSTKVFGLALSGDERILYLLRQNSSGQKKLEILDISNITAPRLLSSIAINTSTESTSSMGLSSDERILFIGLADGVLMIDVHFPMQPKLVGFYYFLSEKHASMFARTKNMFYSASENGVTAYNMSSQYILHLAKSNFEIGELFLGNLFVLKLNRNFKFDFLAEKHKFQKVSLFGAQALKALPNWITFDKERSALRIEPNSASTNGTFKIVATLSTQAQSSSFIGLNLISNETAAEELMLNLIHSGYSDPQGYISENFDLNQKLRIDAKYNNIEKEIRMILSQSYIQAIAEIHVSPSLTLSETKPLKISTRSKGTISVTIQFDQTNGSPQFITKAYPYVKSHTMNEKSELILEGSIENVNEALRQVVVDLQGLGVCGGIINIKDGINPPMTRSISFLSDYFANNMRPIYNSLTFALEKQIANQSGFYTGQYSGIEFHPQTFTDQNNLTLEYFLQMPDPKKVLPSWINLKGLSLIGTPPESYSTFSYHFILVAKNEFQNITVPFTINIHLSFSYGVRLVMTFGGYLVTSLGFILTINKIYNIIARKRYRYPRSFKLRRGDEVSDSKIFPISFVKAEIDQSNKFFKQLQKDDPELQILDKQKILEMLEDGYLDEGENNFSHEVVKQLLLAPCGQFLLILVSSKFRFLGLEQIDDFF